jgi:hypothetical protein
MQYWNERAQAVDGNLDHEWRPLFADYLKTARPALREELEADGELAAYITVKIASAQDDLDEMIESGMEAEVAKEIALNDLLNSDFAQSEE